MGKTTKWRHMIGQADSDDGVRKPRLIWQKQADKMAITRGKMGMVSFLHKLEIRKLCLKLVSFLHKLETKINYAWNQFHFYTSLKRNKLCLKIKHAPSMVTQFEVHAPQASVHWKWSEGSNYEIRERLDWDFTRSKQRLELNRNVFHFLTRLTH